MIAITVLGVILTVAIPNLIQSKVAAREAEAVSTIRAIVSAQWNYSLMGGGNYASSLSQLEERKLIDEDVASGIKGGYSYQISGGGTTFELTARPLTYGTTGTTSFYADESGVIRYTMEDASPDATSPMLASKGQGKKGG